jgi:hypothetical protein
MRCNKGTGPFTYFPSNPAHISRLLKATPARINQVPAQNHIKLLGVPWRLTVPHLVQIRALGSDEYPQFLH